MKFIKADVGRIENLNNFISIQLNLNPQKELPSNATLNIIDFMSLIKYLRSKQ